MDKKELNQERNLDINSIAKVCATCGNCLHACPVYNAEFIEPNSPRGKINLVKALMGNRLKPNKLNRKFISQCLLCGSCEDICTKDVEYVKMMINFRNKFFEGGKIPLFKKAILTAYQPLLFKNLGWIIKLMHKTPLTRFLSIPDVKNIKGRKIHSSNSKTKVDVLLFPGCVLTYFYTSLIKKIVLVLEEKGLSVAVPTGLNCCGFPYITQGWEKKFTKLKKKNSDIIAAYDYKYLVTPCGTCTYSFKEYYELQDVEVHELTDFMYHFAKDSKVNREFLSPDKGKVTYHDPCHNLKTYGIKQQPRSFLKQLGKRFVDDNSGLCCGFGGIFCVGFPKTSKSILNRKKKVIKDSGADTVVTSCPGCYMQLESNLEQDVKFFIELF